MGSGGWRRGGSRGTSETASERRRRRLSVLAPPIAITTDQNIIRTHNRFLQRKRKHARTQTQIERQGSRCPLLLLREICSWERCMHFVKW